MNARFRAVNRKAVTWLSILLVVSALLAGSWELFKLQAGRERKTWKDKTLVPMAATSIADQEILTEIDQIKHPTPDINFGWTNRRVLLMANDEYLIYEFRHGANNGFVDHLFLAHGSDGRWYYSSYHFCNSMAGVIGEERPKSIADFVSHYAAREFDGKSDVCLQHTWP